MGDFEFSKAVSAMRDEELECPKCHASNLRPPATPSVEIDKNGRGTCNACGHVWTVNLSLKENR